MTVKEIRAHQNWRWHCGCKAANKAPAPTPAMPRKNHKGKQEPRPKIQSSLKILQVNVCGIRQRAQILAKLAEEEDADVLVIQESKLMQKTEVPKQFASWTCHRQERKIHPSQKEQPQGGVITLVKPGLSLERLADLCFPGDSAMESVGVKIHIQKPVKIWNFYRPPAKSNDGRNSQPYSSEWPTDADIILGDLNAHGFWDRNHPSDETGEEIESWLSSNQWIALNDGTPTRMAGDGETTPDITLVPGDSYGKVKWNVLDTIGSDHLPIKVTVEGRERKEKVKRRLNLEKLDVNKYQNTFSELLKEARTEENLSLEKEFKIFVDLVLRAAQKSAPLTSSKPKKTWWTEECTTARKKMKTAFKQMRKNPCEEQRNQYQQARDTLFDTIKSSKRKAWREFASTLSPRTPSSKVWGVLKSIDGRKKQKLPDVPLTAGDKKAITKLEKADLSVKTYAANSHVRIPREAQKTAYTAVRKAIKKNPTTPLDEPFSSAELHEALRQTKLKCPGEDQVHPLLLKSLPEEGKAALLQILNRSWLEGKVPSQWRRALIIPVLKKRKPPTEIKSYRPVSLLSSIAKLCERTIASRLLEWALKRNLIPEEQSGFRPKRSTLDTITNIAQQAFNQLQKKERTLLVAVDLKSAFDRIWRGGLLRDLAAMDISPGCLKWLRAFLTDRRAAVRWDGLRSKEMVFKEGVPQGSPLSPLLFILGTRGLPIKIRETSSVRCDVYADDITLHVSSARVEDCQQEMQKALNSIDAWTADTHMEVAKDKTEAIVISLDPRETAGKSQPRLQLAAADVSYNKTVKILGVEIDSQCTFKTQAVNATRKLKERNQVLSCMAGKSWGPKGSDIRHTYKAYTRPGGLYGCGVWGPFIAQTNLKKLETCNTRAARLITGCPSGSNNANTLAEAQLPTIATFIKDEAVRQYSKLLEFPEGHHLKELTRTAYTRARLKSRGDAEYRKDRRRTAEEHHHQLQITNTKETKNKLQQTEEMRIKNDYLAARKEGSDYDRTCRGDPPPVLLVPHSREDEVFVHQLRVNRCPILAECKHRFGKIPEPQCPHCNLEEETALHFLTKCPKWKKQRKKAGLPTNPFETPEKILDFAKDTGVYPSS